MIYPIDQRRLRLQQTKAILKELVPCEIRRAIAIVSVNLGVSTAKALEYIKVLAGSGSFELIDGEVTKPIEEKVEQKEEDD